MVLLLPTVTSFDTSLHHELSSSFASSFPSPLSSPSLCLPKHTEPPPSTLCDPDGLLASSSYPVVSAAIEALNNLPIQVCGTPPLDKTHLPDRVEAAVVLLDRMVHIPSSQYPSSSSEPDDVDRFYLRSAKILAEAIHDSYGVGEIERGAKRQQKHYTVFLHDEQPSTRRFAPRPTGHVDPPSCSSSPPSSISTGLLFLISKNDRTMHVSTSSGVDAILTPSRVTSIVNAAKPHFRKDDLQSGIVAALDKTAAYLVKGPPGFMEKYFVSGVIFRLARGAKREE